MTVKAHSATSTMPKTSTFQRARNAPSPLPRAPKAFSSLLPQPPRRFRITAEGAVLLARRLAFLLATLQSLRYLDLYDYGQYNGAPPGLLIEELR